MSTALADPNLMQSPGPAKDTNFHHRQLSPELQWPETLHLETFSLLFQWGWCVRLHLCESIKSPLWQQWQIVWEWVGMAASHLTLLAAATSPSFFFSFIMTHVSPPLCILKKERTLQRAKEGKGRTRGSLTLSFWKRSLALSPFPYRVWVECLHRCSAHSHLPVLPLVQTTEIFYLKRKSLSGPEAMLAKTP